VPGAGFSVLNRGFCTAFAASLCYFLGIGVVLPVLPLFISTHLHGGNLIVGIVVGVFAASAVVARPVAGRLGNRLGRRRLMLIGAAVVSASFFLYGTAVGVVILIIWRLLTGAGEGFFFTGSATLVADMAPEEKRAQVLSYFSLALYAGLGIGPVLGETVYRATDATVAFIVAGSLALVGAAVSQFVPDDRVDHRGIEPKHFFHRKAIGPGLVLIGGIMGITAFQAFTPLYARELHMSGSQWVFLLYSGVVMTARIVAAPLLDRITVKRVASSATGLIVLGLCTMSIWGTPAGLYVGAVIFALGVSLQYPALMTMVVNRVTPTERSSAVGTFTMSFDLAQGAAGFLLGAVAAAAGYRASFAVGAATALMGLVLLLSFVARDREPRFPQVDERTVLSAPDAWLSPGAE
jgi:MFS family permease